MSEEPSHGLHGLVRVIRWVILLPLAGFIILFVLDNRQSTDVELPLTGIAFEAPLFLLLLIVFILGLAIGGIAAWLGAWKWRHRLRRERRAREALQRDYDKLKNRAGTSRAVAEKSPYLPPED